MIALSLLCALAWSAEPAAVAEARTLYSAVEKARKAGELIEHRAAFNAGNVSYRAVGDNRASLTAWIEQFSEKEDAVVRVDATSQIAAYHTEVQYLYRDKRLRFALVSKIAAAPIRLYFEGSGALVRFQHGDEKQDTPTAAMKAFGDHVLEQSKGAFLRAESLNAGMGVGLYPEDLQPLGL